MIFLNTIVEVKIETNALVVTNNINKEYPEKFGKIISKYLIINEKIGSIKIKCSSFSPVTKPEAILAIKESSLVPYIAEIPVDIQ